jgi:shikimate dehydrogenase
MTVRYAVVGDPVAHSLSPPIHRAALAALGLTATYEAIRVEVSALQSVFDDLADGRLAGVNVTMPHKQRAFQLADEVRGEAQRAGSVNTLMPIEGGVVGLSTDVPAIRTEWARKGLPRGSALILGSGGAAAAALIACEDMELFASARAPGKLSALLQRIGVEAEILPWGSSVPGVVLVNATPLGMNGEALPPGLLAESEGLFDMAYGHLPTPAVIAAGALGQAVVEGLDMLVAQAALSLEAWTALPAPVDVMRRAAQIAQGR